jgi:glycosyltransferase involved in cell wall biosynthesis
MGESVLLLSTRKPSPLICRHAFAAEAVLQTHYLFPPAPANLAAWCATGGRGLRRGLRYLRELAPAPINVRLRQYTLLVPALDLLQWARRERIDHIHVHSCADAAHIAALARRMGGPSYSLTLHGDLSVYGTDHRAKMKGASFVSTVGTHLREQVLDRTEVSPDRVFVTCMGVDTRVLATLGKDRLYRANVLHVVSIARLNPAKGHVHALAAVHRARRAGIDIHFTIAGEGPYQDVIAARIRELGLADCVTMTGTLSENEVSQLLSKANAFVLSSVGLGEAWPVSVMEAMAAGLPVIASTIGATPEMISTGKDGYLVPQGDEDALFEKIMVLAGDVDERRRVGEAAQSTAAQRFDIAVTAEALRNAIYKRQGRT